MSYPYEHVHKDITDNGTHLTDYKKIVIDDDVYLFHIPTLGVLSTGQNSKDFSINKEDLIEAEKDFPAVFPGKIRDFPVDVSAIALNVAEQCNLRCSYCYAGDGDYGADDLMGIEVAKKSLEMFVGSKSSFTIVFFGGEPLLNFSLIKETVLYAVKTYPKTTFNFRMTTNGLLLNKSVLEFIEQYGFNLTVSYDGQTAQKKQRLNLNRQENKKDFAAERLKKFEGELSKLKGFKIRSTISSSLLDSFESDLKAIKDNYSHHVGFNRVATNDVNLKYTLDDAKKMMDSFERLAINLLREKQYEQVLSLDNVGGFIKIVFGRYYLSKTCGAGLSYISVSTKGKFYLCHRFTEDQEECVGSLADGLDTEKLSSISQHRTVQHEPCKSCWMKSLCRGGCFHENKMERGTKHSPDPIFCYMQDRQVKLAIRCLMDIKAHASHLLEPIKDGRLASEGSFADR